MLKQTREQLGLTQEQMASLMGMNQPNYARLETGARELTLQHKATLNMIQFMHNSNMLSLYMSRPKRELPNNEIMKKVRVALKLKIPEDIQDAFAASGIQLSKDAVQNFFKAEDNPKFRELGDEYLEAFLDGLIILRRES